MYTWLVGVCISLHRVITTLEMYILSTAYITSKFGITFFSINFHEVFLCFMIQNEDEKKKKIFPKGADIENIFKMICKEVCT